MTRNIYKRSRRNLECLNRDEQFPHDLPPHPDLNAANASQPILIKESRGLAAAGADVREETGRADVLEDVAADDHQWHLPLSWLRVWAELVDVQENLAWALSDANH